MKMPVSNAELLTLLYEQLDFIEASALSYDQGFHGKIKRLALSTQLVIMYMKIGQRNIRQ